MISKYKLIVFRNQSYIIFIFVFLKIILNVGTSYYNMCLFFIFFPPLLTFNFINIYYNYYNCNLSQHIIDNISTTCIGLKQRGHQNERDNCYQSAKLYTCATKTDKASVVYLNNLFDVHFTNWQNGNQLDFRTTHNKTNPLKLTITEKNKQFDFEICIINVTQTKCDDTNTNILLFSKYLLYYSHCVFRDSIY